MADRNNFVCPRARASASRCYLSIHLPACVWNTLFYCRHGKVAHQHRHNSNNVLYLICPDGAACSAPLYLRAECLHPLTIGGSVTSSAIHGILLIPHCEPETEPLGWRKKKRKEGYGGPVKTVLPNQEPATPARGVKLRCSMGYYLQFFRRCPKKE